MYWEAYNTTKHGIVGKMKKIPKEEWVELFEAATREPVVVRAVQRQTLHYAAKRCGYTITANGLADGDGFVVRAVKDS